MPVRDRLCGGRSGKQETAPESCVRHQRQLLPTQEDGVLGAEEGGTTGPGPELGWAVSSGSLSLWWPHAEVATLTGPDGQEGFPHLGCFKGHVLDTVFPLGANSPPVPCRVSPASQPARGVPSLARESLRWLGTNRPRREVDATSLVPRGRLCWRVWVQWFRLETQEPGSLLARKTGTSGHIVLGPGCLISAVFP